MESKITNLPKDLESVFEKHENDAFITALKKRLRNMYKKLNEIIELKRKTELNESQLEKVKAKDSVEEKIAECRSYLDLYVQSKEEDLKTLSTAQCQSIKKVSALFVLAQNEKFLGNKEIKLNLIGNVNEENKIERFNTTVKTIVDVLSNTKDNKEILKEVDELLNSAEKTEKK